MKLHVAFIFANEICQSSQKAIKITKFRNIAIIIQDFEDMREKFNKILQLWKFCCAAENQI